MEDFYKCAQSAEAHVIACVLSKTLLTEFRGFHAFSTIGDGNCLWRTVSQGMWDTEQYWTYVKRVYVHFAYQKKHLYRILDYDLMNKISAGSATEDEAVDKHISERRKFGNHGGHPDLLLVAPFLKRNFLIHSSYSSTVVIRPGADEGQAHPEQWPAIHIWYQRLGHYTHLQHPVEHRVAGKSPIDESTPVARVEMLENSIHERVNPF